MWAYVFFVVVASGLLAFALKMLFKRRGNWLPISITAILPPLIFVPYGVFGLLRDIGATEEATGSPPANMVDNFATGLSTLLAKGAIWLLVALAISVFVVRWVHRKYKS